MISASQKIPQLEVTSDKEFWTLLRHDAPRRETKWGKILVMLWAIWLHLSKRVASTDGVIHEVEGFVSC